MLDALKGLFKKKKIAAVATEQVKSAKQIATEKGEAYFEILSMDIDPNDINAGAFEFDWNDKLPGFYKYVVENKKLHSIGLIAQNVKKYFPEVVGLNNGYYFVKYDKLNAVLVEAIKEQQVLIEDIDKELNFIESKLS